jgi:capsule polysaccharide export protein KpsE/RkpR
LSSAGRVPAPDIDPAIDKNGAPGKSLFMEAREEPIRLLPYLQLLWQNRRFLLRAMFSAFVASALIAVLIHNQYHAVARLMPPDTQSASGLGFLAAMAGKAGTGSGVSGFGGGIASDLLGVKSSGALFVGIVTSQTVQDRVIHDFDLQHIYGDSKIEDARNDLAQHTDVAEDRKSGIITIGVTDRDPKRAAAMAHAYVDELDRLVAQVSTSSARRERIFLEERLKTVKAELDSTAKNFSNFASKNTAIDIPAQGKAMVEAAASLQGRLIAAQAELSGLQQIYTNNNVRVRAAEARVKELQEKLNELGRGDPADDSKEENALYPSIRRLPVLGVTYADLFLHTKIQATVFELLTQQYETAKVQEAKEIPSVKVLDAPVVPTKKSFPPRIVLTIFGTLLGLSIAMVWVVARTSWDAVDASHPRKVFATEVLTTMRSNLPRFSRNGTGADSNGNSRWTWRKKSLNEHEENPADKDDIAK